MAKARTLRFARPAFTAVHVAPLVWLTNTPPPAVPAYKVAEFTGSITNACTLVFARPKLKTDQLTDHLINDYFGMRRFEWEDEVDFQLPYGEWIRLFRRAGFVVEDLIETQPSRDATSTYRDTTETAWARRWPMENIWKLRKE